MYQASLETPNGAITTFTSSIPGTLVPTLNGQVLSEGYAQLSPTQVRFEVAPRMDDTVGFFVT